MRNLFFLTSLALTLLSANAYAAPTNPLNCVCGFENVVPGGMGLVDATDCQLTEETDYVRERQQQGAFTETLTFVGGAGQACATMQVRKFKRDNDTQFSCTIWIQQSNSGDAVNCSTIIPRNRPVSHSPISRRNMRACQRLLDDVAEVVDALPDCRAP